MSSIGNSLELVQGDITNNLVVGDLSNSQEMVIREEGETKTVEFEYEEKESVDDVEEEEIESPRSMTSYEAVKYKISLLLEDTSVTIIMSLLTIYALFGDDLRLLAFSKTADEVFMIFSSISFFLFLLELLLSCWVKEGYLRLPDLRSKEWQDKVRIGSFYFWLDLIATASLIFEVSDFFLLLLMNDSYIFFLYKMGWY